MSLLDLGKQVRAWISLQLQHFHFAADVVPPQMLPEDYRSIVRAKGVQSLGQEARGKGSTSKGMDMYAPLRMLH